MYEIECLTTSETLSAIRSDSCRPFSGACYPDVEGKCGPDCSPMDDESNY